MESKFIDLFKELAKATAVTAEQVMDYNHEQDDNEGFEKAQIMRDDFMALYDKLSSEDFDGKLEKADYARLMVGAYVISNNMRNRLTLLKNSIKGYEETLIPKLQEILNAEEKDIQSVAEKILILEDNN